MEQTVAAIFSDFGRLDIFVANSGAGKSFDINGSEVEDWKQIIEVVSLRIG